MSDGTARADIAVGPQAASTVRRTKRQRRPTGAPPPLPRHIAVTTTAWLVLAAILVAGAFLVSGRAPWRAVVDQANTWLLQQLATVRTPWLTHVANGINTAGLYWHPVIGGAAAVRRSGGAAAWSAGQWRRPAGRPLCPRVPCRRS